MKMRNREPVVLVAPRGTLDGIERHAANSGSRNICQGGPKGVTG